MQALVVSSLLAVRIVAETWTEHSGLNCYEGHGAADLEKTHGQPCGTMSLAECEGFCDKLPGCTGIVMSSGSGDQACFRRGSIDLSKCDSQQYNNYNTYVKSVSPSPPPPPVVGSAILIQTAQDTGDRLSKKDDLNFVADWPSTDLAVVDVSSTDVDQEIVGFGGAFTEAAAVTFQGLSENLQQQVLKMYFGSEGIGYSIGRVHINSCDFSVASYSFDDVAGDFELEHFDDNVTHDTKALIPLIKGAQQEIEAAGSSLKLFASPWSPPAWMKSNGKMDGSGWPGLLDNARGAWAKYFVKWISAYQAHGIPIWAVTVQNEPSNAPGWEACTYNAQQEADFLGDYLGPALQSAHPDVKVFVFDMYGGDAYNWAKTVYSHATAGKYTSGVAFHWYGGDIFNVVKSVHKDYPQALLLPSEATYEKSQFKQYTVENGQWSFGEGYAHDILGNLNAGSVGWTDWNLLLNQQGGPNHVGNNCDAPMLGDGTKQQLYMHPQYFYIGHFSKYLPRGSKRIMSTVTFLSQRSGAASREQRSKTNLKEGSGYGACVGGLQATSFQRPDGKIATVVLNCGGSAISFKLRDGGRAIRASIPAHGIQTYLFLRAAETVLV